MVTMMRGHHAAELSGDRLACARVRGTGRVARANIGGVEIEGPPREIALVLRAFGAGSAPRLVRLKKPRPRKAVKKAPSRR